MDANQKTPVRACGQVRHVTDILHPEVGHYELKMRLESDDPDGARTMMGALIVILRAFSTGGERGRELLYNAAMKLGEEVQ